MWTSRYRSAPTAGEHFPDRRFGAASGTEYDAGDFSTKWISFRTSNVLAGREGEQHALVLWLRAAKYWTLMALNKLEVRGRVVVR
jgi:hypothetical protein